MGIEARYLIGPGINYERPVDRYALMLTVLLSVLEKLRKYTNIYYSYIDIFFRPESKRAYCNPHDPGGVAGSTSRGGDW